MAQQFTVLVVDDEDDIRDIAYAFLSSAGYRVLTASGGYEALRLLAMEKVDVLFTDVRMPHMSGYDLVGRATQVQPSLRVLYTSGFCGNASCSNRPDAGTIFKPWRAHQLISAISHLLTAHEEPVG